MRSIELSPNAPLPSASRPSRRCSPSVSYSTSVGAQPVLMERMGRPASSCRAGRLLRSLTGGFRIPICARARSSRFVCSRRSTSGGPTRGDASVSRALACCCAEQLPPTIASEIASRAAIRLRPKNLRVQLRGASAAIGGPLTRELLAAIDGRPPYSCSAHAGSSPTRRGPRQCFARASADHIV
jgi:hypothetical protein